MSDTDKIDEILSEVDPAFTQSLREMKATEDDKTVEIESLVPNEDALNSDSYFEDKAQNKSSQRFRLFLLNLKLNLKSQTKEFVFYSFSQIKIFIARIIKLSLLQKLALLLIIALFVTLELLLKMNLKGSWLPTFNQQFLSNYEPVADKIETIEPDDLILMRVAFPQPEFQVQLEKVTINFKRRPNVAENPMGVFEIYLGVDNKDTAIEVRARKNEFIDIVSRTLEDLTYTDATDELGTARIKSLVKDAMNQNLTQGTVMNVYLKTKITKP